MDIDGDGINDKLKGRIKFTADADKIVSVGIIIPLTAKLSVSLFLNYLSIKFIVN